MNKKLKIALPAGSMKEATLNLMRKAGLDIRVPERSYFPTTNDSEIECTLIRTQEIGRYVSIGKFDFGITGKDWIEEMGADVMEIGEFPYSKNGSKVIRLALVVPEKSEIKTEKDLEGKTIATEFVNITDSYLRSKGIMANVEFSWGATEAKPPYLADAIVEVVDSGASIKVNNLRVITNIFESTARAITNNKSYADEWKKKKMIELVKRLKNSLPK